jgi:hypothetical protein
LLELLRDAPQPIARQAIEALAVFRHDSELRARVLDATAERAAALQAFARQTFGA